MLVQTKKLLAIVIAALIMIASLAGCGGASSGSGETSAPTAADTASAAAVTTAAKTPDPVELNIILPPDSVNDYQSVVDEFHNRTKDTLNITLKLNFVGFGDINNKVTMKLSAGEQLDAVFDAQWISLQDMINKGIYQQLDKYFNNDGYPGLKKAFSSEYVNNNKFSDRNGEYHVYAIPFTRAFASATGMYIRKDLREKYGLPEIRSLSDLEAFFDKVLENEKGIVPLGIDGATSGLYELYVHFDPQFSLKNVNTGVNGYFVMVNDDKTVVVSGGQDYNDALSGTLNTPYDPLTWPKRMRQWYVKGYTHKDLISEKNSLGNFKAGKYASVYCTGANTADNYMDIVQTTESTTPGAKVEFFALDEYVRNSVPGSVPTDYKAWNFQCIPTTSKNADRTMQFFDWLFSDVKNHDLFEYGIENKHFIPIGDNKYQIPEGMDLAKNYNLLGYQLTWNPTMIRYPVDLPENMIKINNFLNDIQSYYLRPLTGFTFNDEAVKDEQAKISALGDIAKPLSLGLIEESKIAEYYQEVEDKTDKAGRPKIRAEIKRQAEEWLANQK